MNNNTINKLAILISWPREIDMLLPLIKKLPKKKIVIIANDNNSFETGRDKSNKLILNLLKKNNIKHELFSDIYNKKKFRFLISTGEISGKKITLFSLLRFFYAFTFGFIVEKTKLFIIFEKIFNKPLTANGLHCKPGLPWYPEKKIAEVVIKYPDGADVKKKNYPYNFLKEIFDIFLVYTDIEISLIKKKFSSKICKKIDYFRYKNLSSKKKAFKDFENNKYFNKNKKILYWLPTHVDFNNENDLNIKLWFKKIAFLRKNFNLIIRPHPKTILSNKNILAELINEKFIIDNSPNRKIGDVIKHSKLVFCDYGGPVFSSIYLNKSLILLNLPENSKFNVELRANQSLDVTARNELASLDINSTEKQILKRVNESLNSKYTKKLKKIKKKHFGTSKPYNINELSKFLINLFAKRDNPNYL